MIQGLTEQSIHVLDEEVMIGEILREITTLKDILMKSPVTKCEGTGYCWYMILHQFLDNSTFSLYSGAVITEGLM